MISLRPLHYRVHSGTIDSVQPSKQMGPQHGWSLEQHMTPEGSIIEQPFTLGFPAINNKVEYEAVIADLKMVETLGVTGLEVRCDSLLVVSQVKGEYTAKDERMMTYLHLVLSMKSKFLRCDFKQISRLENNHADSLTNLGSAVEHQLRREIPIKHIAEPNIQRSGGEVLCLDTSSGWRDPIIAYLKDGVLPDDRAEAQKLQHLATRYTLLGNILYKKSYSKLHSNPYLKCLERDEAKKVMQEIRYGDCGNHACGRVLHKAINQGYYWPKMFQDAKEYVKTCPQCQRLTLSLSRPSEDLHTLRALGPSCNEDWICWALFLEHNLSSSSYWSPPITSPNRLKLCLFPRSLDNKWSSSYGRTLYVTSASRILSSLITGQTLPVRR